MSQSIHAHDVISLLEAHPGLSTEQQIEVIHRTYGDTATYFTCAAEGLDAGQLLQFMEARGILWADGLGGWAVRTQGDACIP